jgi:cytochrome oxidase Cu insertion factor (SCO1/SenC/PrrC family)
MDRLLVVCVAVFAACGGSGPKRADAGVQPVESCAPESARGVQVGQCAPDFSLPDARGETRTLSSFRGKVALIDISALW